LFSAASCWHTDNSLLFIEGLINSSIIFLVAVKRRYMKMNEGKVPQGFSSNQTKRISGCRQYIAERRDGRRDARREGPEPVWTWWLEQSAVCVTGVESWLFRWPVRAIESRHHDKSAGISSVKGHKHFRVFLNDLPQNSLSHSTRFRMAVGWICQFQTSTL